MGPNQTDLKRKHKATQGPTRNASRSQIALMALVQSICGKVTALSIHVSRAYSVSRADILFQTDTRNRVCAQRPPRKLMKQHHCGTQPNRPQTQTQTQSDPRTNKQYKPKSNSSDGPGFRVFWLGHCDEHAAYMYHEFVAFRVPAS